jgi:hypothetical protein
MPAPAFPVSLPWGPYRKGLLLLVPRILSAYQDLPPAQGGYAPVNPPLPTSERGTPAIDVNRWQPMSITTAFSQNGLPISSLQKFLGSQWKAVRPFALTRDDATQLWTDPGPPPQLGGLGDAQFRAEVLAVIRRSSELTPDDGVVLDLSPGAFGNNSFGANDGKGHPVNPATGLTQGSDRMARTPTAADIDDETAIGFENATEFRSKSQKPIDIFVLINVAVGLLEVERVRR